MICVLKKSSKFSFTWSVSYDGFFLRGRKNELSNSGRVQLKGDRGRNQEVSRANFFLHPFSISVVTLDGEYVLAPSSSGEQCPFQHFTSTD